MIVCLTDMLDEILIKIATPPRCAWPRLPVIWGPETKDIFQPLMTLVTFLWCLSFLFVLVFYINPIGASEVDPGCIELKPGDQPFGGACLFTFTEVFVFFINLIGASKS